jgi:hypothetical protein
MSPNQAMQGPYLMAAPCWTLGKELCFSIEIAYWLKSFSLAFLAIINLLTYGLKQTINKNSTTEKLNFFLAFPLRNCIDQTFLIHDLPILLIILLWQWCVWFCVFLERGFIILFWYSKELFISIWLVVLGVGGLIVARPAYYHLIHSISPSFVVYF